MGWGWGAGYNTMGSQLGNSRVELMVSPSSPWEIQEDSVLGSIVPTTQAPRALSQLPLELADTHMLLHPTPEYHLGAPPS